MITQINSEIVKNLVQPLPSSHKGNNGRILIIGGSEKYHGAPILAAKMASKIVDVVYFFSAITNNEIVKKMKSELAEFIILTSVDLPQYIPLVDVVLIGIGMEQPKETEDTINNFLKYYPEKKVVIDADAIKMVDKSFLNRHCILTPHAKEFEILFHLPATSENVFMMSKQYHAIILLKGQKDYVSDGEDLWENVTGNAGMTKGGTGDVLSGLITALAAKNELCLAAKAGVFINGYAGDRLKKKVSFFFNASDLVAEIPYVLKELTE
ncbi:MAG: Carbohydrate kinase, YjeF related protein [candidate division CPR3 bacterium GW2011_GWE2_35_7]|nr:MAG: Carbohydrate kinase, YjeF related protein [candidate division CPR3 bacterium GW2011_GWE2_35_7]